MTVLGRRTYSYPNGRKYRQYFFRGHTENNDGLLDRLIEDMRANVYNDYDNLVVCYGPEGSGKSNLGVQICKMYDPTFTLQERYIYDFLPFLQRLQEDFKQPGNGRAYLLDEATNLASNRDWNQTDNKNMIQLLEMFRSRGLTLVMCIPSFERLDKYIREFRARFRLECKDLPKGNRFEGRGYFELTICKGNRTVGIGTFDQMNEEDKRIYEELKKSSQEKKLDEMIRAADPEQQSGGKRLQESNDRNKKMAFWFIDHEGWSYDDVSDQFGIPKGTLRRWMKEMRDL